MSPPEAASDRPAVGSAVARVVAALAIRPRLWPTAVGQLFALAPTGWWRRRPFLPLPAPAYLAFRLQTMYGRPRHRPGPDDVVAYLEWCRELRRRRPHGR